MIYILLCTTMSVIVSIYFKVAKNKNLNINQLIFFNYISAALLALYLLPHPNITSSLLNNFKLPNYGLLIILGILLPSVFIFYATSVRKNGLVKSEIAQRVSLILPIITSFTLFSESLSLYKIIAIILAFLGMILLFDKKRESDCKKDTTFFNILLFIIVFLGYGLADILFKKLSNTGLQLGIYLPVIFFLASIFMIFYLIFLKEKIKLKNTVHGLILGCLNFFNIYYYIKAHQYLRNDPSLVFTSVNILIIIVGYLVGYMIFQEKLSKKNILGIFIAIISIFTLFYGQEIINFINQIFLE